ncbi:DUF5666 domain-containing protein [Parvularcula lutaonensis]|uniref:DUF5666 domain-containing protein n=1 Tax=Parvularcula lutaonensis TaxID=491923 RepID=A0ABV7MDH3_9PROT|nr:hypothetical protein GCM10007148_06450 [Parvularcula lutaonensis]
MFVNGKKFEVLNSTVVQIEGQNGVGGGQSLLRLGQKVRVEARALANSNEADVIVFDEDLRGPAVRITPDGDDPSVGTFKVIGQTVTVDALTIIGEDFTDLNGDGAVDIRDLDGRLGTAGAPFIVEVSGSVTESGFIASRIDKIDRAAGDPNTDGDEYEVKGFVDQVIGSGTSIVINGTEFLIDNATVLEDGLIADDTLLGVFVEVKADQQADGSYIAREIELGDDNANDAPQENEEFEIEGILIPVDTSVTPNTIVIGGRTIEVDDASGLASLVGQRVEIGGTFDAAGTLVVSKTEVEVENTLGVWDEVASIDTAGGTFTTRLGIVIEPTGESRLLDLSDPQGGPQRTVDAFLSRLSVGDDIRAKGYPDASGAPVWTRIRVEPKDRDGCRVMGPPSDPITAGVSFTILGVTVETSSMTAPGSFLGADDTDLGADAFYNQIASATAVKAKASGDAACATGRMTLADGDEVSLEEDDGVAANGDDSGTESEDIGVIGSVSAIDAANGFLTVAGQEVFVGPATMIDNDIVAAFKGTSPAQEQDTAFANLSASLDAVFTVGDVLEIELDIEGAAVEIEYAN